MKRLSPRTSRTWSTARLSSPVKRSNRDRSINHEMDHSREGQSRSRCLLPTVYLLGSLGVLARAGIALLQGLGLLGGLCRFQNHAVSRMTPFPCPHKTWASAAPLVGNFSDAFFCVARSSSRTTDRPIACGKCSCRTIFGIPVAHFFCLLATPLNLHGEHHESQ